MARNASRSQRAFAAAVLVTVVLALLPTSWLLPWTSGLAAVLSAIVQPAGQVGVSIRNWLRPPNDPVAKESQQVQQLIDDREELRQLLYASRLRIEVLEEEMRERQDAQRFNQGVQIDPLFARITGRTPDRPRGMVRLNVGARNGVTPGTVAVFRGVHLIGRVAGDVARLSSWLVPIIDRNTGLLEAIILPADDPVAPVEDAPRLQLTQDTHGALIGDLEKDVVVQRGDIVRLSDPAWPDSAQGMIIGFVESVREQDQRPLLNAITVRPQYHAHRLAFVTLKIERRVSRSEGDRP